MSKLAAGSKPSWTPNSSSLEADSLNSADTCYTPCAPPTNLTSREPATGLQHDSRSPT